MTRLWRAVLALALAAGALIVGGDTPASATTWATVDWGMGRPMTDWYSTNQNQANSTAGIWFLGGDFHAYLGVPAHTLEHGWNDCRGCSIFSSRHDFYNRVTEKFDLFSVKWSPVTGADFAIVDFGSIFTGGSTPFTNLMWNYCNTSRSDQARCSTLFSGGSGANAPNVGSWMTSLGGSAPTFGSFVCRTGTKGGTSCGTVTSTSFVHDNEYAHFAYHVEPLDRCGTAPTDSGSPVFADQGNGQMIIVGVEVAAVLNHTGPNGGCYPSNQLWGDTMEFIGVDQIQSWFAPFTGGALIVAS